MWETVIFVFVMILVVRKWVQIKSPFLLCGLILMISIFVTKKFDLPVEFSMMCMAFGGGIALLVYFLQRRKEKFLGAFALLFFTLGILLLLQTVIAMGHQDALFHFLLRTRS